MPNPVRRAEAAIEDLDRFTALKNAHLIATARRSGLIGGRKSRKIAARMDEALVAAAKARTGIESDSELLQLALANLAVGDDFGEWLLAQAGRLDPDFELEL